METGVPVKVRRLFRIAAALSTAFAIALACALCGCSQPAPAREGSEPSKLEASDVGVSVQSGETPGEEAAAPTQGGVGEASEPTQGANGSGAVAVQESEVDAARAALDLTEDYRASFMHGDKPAAFQKYIVLHDTEGEGSAAGVVDYWDSNGAGVAAHFIVNKDGSIVQCVPLDEVAHHAGFGDAGHNELFGVAEDGRDDMVGTVPIGDWAPDYGMNAWSVGIEMVHVGGSGGYPEAQLEAVDALIAYIDAYFGFESEVIDHKAWRTGNSDTSPEFASYLENYQQFRRHA